ncbi:MAG: TolC family protein [Deltaproteobacteria bacterium]|nr:TolC family protein [Deltaproteobacteria bacterium]
MISRRLLAILLASIPLSAAAQDQLTLDQAYEQAVKQSPTLELLKQRVAQAEAARLKAWAALKPTAAFQGTFTHYDQEVRLDFGAFLPPGVKAGDPIVIQKENQFGFNVVASLPLFRGPVYPRLGMTGRAIEQARLQQVRSRQEFLIEVARAYYNVLGQQETVKALENKVQLDAKNVAAARARYEVGKTPRADLLRAELVSTQDEQALLQQRHTLKAGQRQLGILLGLGGSVKATRPPEPATPAGGPGLGDALVRRSDYRATGAGLELARKAKEAVWWGFLPSLDFAWLYRWTEAAGFANQRGQWNLMLTLNLPIYDGGLRYAELREAEAKIREAQALRDQLGRQIESEVVRLQAEVTAAGAAIASAEKALKLARTTAEDMSASYEAGVATQLDVLDANQRQLDAELNLTRTLYQRDVARLSLTHALGRFDPVRERP